VCSLWDNGVLLMKNGLLDNSRLVSVFDLLGEKVKAVDVETSKEVIIAGS